MPKLQAPVNPRKIPRQRRAVVTVDAIVTATTQLLLKEGYDRFTTARAAERAGVSIGSLYQYFPNKAALASAVIDRCCDDFLAAFERALAERRHATLRDCIAAIVDVTLVSHRLPPDLHRVMRELAPADKAHGVSLRVAQAIEAALRRHRDEIADGVDIAAAANVIETTLEALAHRALTAPAGRLAEEATRLITGYLTA